jgi:hypothetical protein
MDRQQRIRIAEELQLVLHDFWHDVDTNWGRKAAEFYTEDGVFEASRNSYQGRQRIADFYAYRISRGVRVAVHAVTNFRAVVESPDAATCHWFLLLCARDGEPILPSAPPIQIAQAVDRCVRGEDGRWRYKHRKFQSLFEGGVPTTTLMENPHPAAAP